MECWIYGILLVGLLWFLSRAKSKKRSAVRREDGRASRRSSPGVRVDSTCPGRISIELGWDDDEEEDDEDTPLHTDSAACWVSRGRMVTIHKRKIVGGMLYVGTGLRGVAQWSGVEPALIDPSLPVDEKRPDYDGDAMTYWPSYTRITPECRSAYLSWLEGGRSQPDACIGYVFLYLYGLERRALHDATSLVEARREIPGIAAEVERLLSVYGEHGSFFGYASQFLSVLRAKQQPIDVGDSPPVIDHRSREIPFDVRIGIAQFATQARPIPSDWALAWVRSDPDTHLGTVARRCAKEFDELFKRRYTQRYQVGMPVKPCKRQIKFSYRPASASFSDEVRVQLELPDVARLNCPRNKLRAIATECIDALDSYSRWLGRNPDGRNTLSNAAFLPPDLIATHAGERFHELKRKIESRLEAQDSTLFSVDDVLAEWLPEDGRKQTKRQAIEAARLFSQAGFGYEPDVRFGGKRLAIGDKVVVFRLMQDEHETPTRSYSGACMLLHLATMVSAADGEIAPAEEEQMREHLANGLQLAPYERRRLGAHLQWLIAEPPGIAGVRKRVEVLSEDQRKAAGKFLALVAWADGRVEPDEVKSLTKIYRLLGLDPTSVHTEIHSIQAGGPPARGPVPVSTPEPGPAGYTIPPEVRSKAAADHPTLAPRDINMDAVRAKLDETAAVSELICSIFEPEGEEPSLSEQLLGGEPDPGDLIHGLDTAHTTLLRNLGERSKWPREEYDALAESLGLMPNGALEVVNDVAFDVCECPLIEGEDPLEIDPKVFQELVT